ncbi:uncharacterized protein G2W53_033988 [Senna tora]|uniref:Uncharacterized protein n=1 Tax=Senna tora TaxID=362788 RepID=A0A834T175_9FABA|nr:uncharacterized protein G2W53_033988 [Senna tora]
MLSSEVAWVMGHSIRLSRTCDPLALLFEGPSSVGVMIFVLVILGFWITFKVSASSIAKTMFLVSPMGSAVPTGGASSANGSELDASFVSLIMGEMCGGVMSMVEEPPRKANGRSTIKSQQGFSTYAKSSAVEKKTICVALKSSAVEKKTISAALKSKAFRFPSYEVEKKPI